MSNGAQLTSNALILGEQAGATGTGTVSGTNSNLNISTYMKVGNLGTGSLTLSGGATATVGGFTYVGDFNADSPPTSSGSGILTVSGAGTQFTTNGVYVRNVGAQTSSVRITDGAIFDNKLGFYAVGDNSTIYVNGTNTALKVGTLTDRPVTWATADGWFSPDAGHIELSGGALLEADGSYIGGSNTATMLVTGAAHAGPTVCLSILAAPETAIRATVLSRYQMALMWCPPPVLSVSIPVPWERSPLPERARFTRSCPMRTQARRATCGLVSTGPAT